MVEIYNYLEEDEKDMLNQLRVDIGAMSSGEWNTVIAPLITAEVITIYGTYELAFDAIQPLIEDMTLIYFNPDSSTMQQQIDDYRTNYAQTFDDLFGTTDSTILLDVLLNTRDNITGGLSSSEKLALTTAGSNLELVTTMDGVVHDAMVEEIATTYPDFGTSLSDIDWSIALLIATQNNILMTASGNLDAKVSVANAVVRSEASISEGATTFDDGDTVDYVFDFFGAETNLVKLYTTSDIVTIENASLTGVDSGSATIYVYRLGGDTTDPNDYIHQFDITVSEVSSGGGGGGGGAPAPASIPPIDTMEDVPAIVEDLADDVAKADSERDAINIIIASKDIIDGMADIRSTINTNVEKIEVINTIESVLNAILSVEDLLEDEATNELLIDASMSIFDDIKLLPLDMASESDYIGILNLVNQVVDQTTGLLGEMSVLDRELDKALDFVESAMELIGSFPQTGQIAEMIKMIEDSIVTLGESVVKEAFTFELNPTQLSDDGLGNLSATLDGSDLRKFARAGNEAVDAFEKLFDVTGLEIDKQMPSTVQVVIPEGFTGNESLVVELSDLGDLFELVENIDVSSSVAGFRLNCECLSAFETVNVAISHLNGNSTDFEIVLIADGQEVHQLNYPISITVPVTQTNFDYVVKHIKEDGTIEYLYTVIEEVNGEWVARFRTSSLSSFYLMNETVHFNDVATTDWFNGPVSHLANMHITQGIAYDEFLPNQAINRWEFLTMLMRILGYEADPAGLPFTDVDTSRWYAKYIASAYENGIVNGKSAVSFAPNDLITREEMSKIMANVLAEKDYILTIDVPTQFKDFQKISLWAVEGVSTSLREGIIIGMPDGSFMPKSNATRAEAATMIYRVLNK